jgi:hypothetical protein
MSKELRFFSQSQNNYENLEDNDLLLVKIVESIETKILNEINIIASFQDSDLVPIGSLISAFLYSRKDNPKNLPALVVRKNNFKDGFEISDNNIFLAEDYKCVLLTFVELLDLKLLDRIIDYLNHKNYKVSQVVSLLGKNKLDYNSYIHYFENIKIGFLTIY